VTFLARDAWRARRFGWARHSHYTNTLLVIEKNELLRVLHAEHELSDHFISYMLSRNIRVEEDLIDQLFNSSERRLARTLLLLARYGKTRSAGPYTAESFPGDPGEHGRNHAFARDFFMNKFRKLGFIEYNGKIKVNKSLLTVVLHELKRRGRLR